MASADNAGFTFQLVGWREARGRFAKATDATKARQTDLANLVMKQLKETAEHLSPIGTSDKGEDEITFLKGWRTTVTQTSTGTEAVLTNIAPHWRFVIEPTKPHAIEPKNASVLHFSIGGEEVFAKSVWHPGTKGNDIPGKLRDQMGKFAVDALGSVAKQVISDIDAAFGS